jgi:hypothetical protein
VHFVLTVAHQPGRSLDELMAPFGEDTNPGGYWKWWTLGGRFGDRLIRADGTRCDVGAVGELDLSGMRRQARAQAEADLDLYRQAIAAHGPLPDLALFDGDWAPDTQRRVVEFWEHPTVRAMRRDLRGKRGGPLFGAEDFTWLSMDPAGWVEARAAGAVLGHDLLTHEGVWLGRGKDWRLPSHRERMTRAVAFHEAGAAYLAGLGADMVLSSVDYHT